MIRLILEGDTIITCQGNFEVTKKVSDINDVSARSGSYSKSISIDGTKENIVALGGYFDINLIASTFNHEKKYACVVEVNGTIVEDRMYFKLTEVVKSKNVHSTDVDKVGFKGVVYNSVSSFYTTMGNKKVKDLKIHKPSDAHDLTIANIRSSYASINDRYVYVLPHKNDYKYYVNQFIPAIFGKVMFDEIFSSNGFEYEWDELTDNSIQFDKWIFPFVGKYKQSDYSKINNQAIIGENPKPLPDESPVDTSWTKMSYAVHSGIFPSSVPNWGVYDEDGIEAYGGGGSNRLSKQPAYTSDYNSFMQIIDNEVVDKASQYNTTTGVFTPSLDSEYTIKVDMSYEIDIEATADSEVNSTSSEGYLEYEYVPYIKKNGAVIYAAIGGGGKVRYEIGDTITSGSNVTTGSISVYITDIFYTTDTINLMGISQFVYRKQGERIWWEDSSTGNPIDITPNFTVTDITLDITPKAKYQDNIAINLNDFLPQKIKQNEFIKSIMTMTNSYIDSDETQSNKLIIKTRDSYYDDGDVKDFSSYIDVSKDSNITFLSNENKKKIELTYKSDNDAYNEAYQNSVQRNYGNSTFTLSNEHLKEEDVQSISFSPTPYAKNQFNAALPCLRTIPEEKESNIRVLLWNGRKDVEGQFLIYNNKGEIISDYEEYYPEALHVNDPAFPSFDLSFGTPLYYFSQGVVPSINNMATLHYRRTLSQINSGKRRVSYFTLPEKDRRELKLSDTIKINNSAYIIDSFVNNYGVSKQTKINLLTIDDGLTVNPTDSSLEQTGSNNGYTYNGYVTQGTSSMKAANNSSNIPIQGEGNIVQQGVSNSSVIGNNNQVSASNVFVLGDGNIADKEGIYTPSLFVNGVDVGQALESSLITIEKTITSAELKTMYTTPIELIESPGVGKIIVPINLFAYFEYGTTPYLLGGSVQLWYGSEFSFWGVSGTAITSSNNVNINFERGSSSSTSDITNKNLNITNDTTDFTSGDGVLKVRIVYYIVDFN